MNELKPPSTGETSANGGEQKLPRKTFIQRFWWIGLIIILVVLLVGFVLIPKKNQRNDSDNSLAETKMEEINNRKVDVKFTQRIFDPEKVSHITPLGEINGGYEEAQTINGVMINIKTDANRNANPIEVYAPTDMTLEDYSYFSDSRSNIPAQWHLGFRISEDVKLSFDHLSSVPDNIKAVTPQTANSGYVPPAEKLSFKAGDRIATTSGTEQAHNWNIYLRDNRKTNTFVNQERYEKLKDRYDFINAVCPFDYYDDVQKNLYIALMGYSEAGESKTCGSNSKDVKGSISGLWHLNREGVQADYRGAYATPFSIYKASSNEIIIYEINKKRFIISDKNSTYKDPASITGSHCYNLTEYGDSKNTLGYVYFKVISDTEMKMSYSASGNCPASFPDTNSQTYYR